jgi:hypothetical protein
LRSWSRHAQAIASAAQNPAIDLEGDLAGILSLASKGKTPSGQGVKRQQMDSVEEIKSFTGARNRLNLLFDAPKLRWGRSRVKSYG